MKKFVVKLGLGTKSIPQKIDFGKSVAQAMGLAPVFATVSNPTILELKNSALALETAANNVTAAGGGTALTSIMHEKEEEFDVKMTAMGNNVDNIALGNKPIILSAGMEADKEREPAQVPGASTDMKANPGLLGATVDLKWKRPQFGKFFNVYFSPDPITPNLWVLKGQTTKTKFTVTGLESLKNYWFRVEAIGTAGTGPPSDPAMSAAL